MREKRGTGFTAYEHEVPDQTPKSAQQIVDALKWHTKRSLRGFDLTLIEQAEDWRQLLAGAGFDGDLWAQRPAIQKVYGKHSFPDLAAKFVGLVDMLQSIRQRLEAGRAKPSDLGDLISHSAECGLILREVWYKAGIDPEMGVTRSALMSHGREFFGKKTSKANRQRKRDAKRRRDSLIDLARKHLAIGHGRFANGKINFSRLADACLSARDSRLSIGEGRARELLREAERNSEL